MKSFAFALLILFYIFIIGSNALSSSKTLLIKERRESYQACIRLRAKAPNLNLNCENLLENIHSEEERKEDSNNNGIKILPKNIVETRKVNKSEEIKLRNLIKELTNENLFKKNYMF